VDYDEVTETEESKQEFIAGMKRGLAQNLCARNQNRLKGKGQQCQDSIEVGELARGSVIVPFDILLDDNLSDEEAQQFTNELQSTPPEELFDGSGYEGQVQQIEVKANVGPGDDGSAASANAALSAALAMLLTGLATLCFTL